MTVETYRISILYPKRYRTRFSTIDKKLTPYLDCIKERFAVVKQG